MIFRERNFEEFEIGKLRIRNQRTNRIFPSPETGIFEKNPGFQSWGFQTRALEPSKNPARNLSTPSENEQQQNKNTKTGK